MRHRLFLYPGVDRTGRRSSLAMVAGGSQLFPIFRRSFAAAAEPKSHSIPSPCLCLIRLVLGGALL